MVPSVDMTRVRWAGSGGLEITEPQGIGPADRRLGRLSDCSLIVEVHIMHRDAMLFDDPLQGVSENAHKFYFFIVLMSIATDT